MVKNPLANAGVAGDMSLIPGLGKSHGEGSSDPLQYSCQDNLMDRGNWPTTSHGVTEELDMIERQSVVSALYNSCSFTRVHISVDNLG